MLHMHALPSHGYRGEVPHNSFPSNSRKKKSAQMQSRTCTRVEKHREKIRERERKEVLFSTLLEFVPLASILYECFNFMVFSTSSQMPCAPLNLVPPMFLPQISTTRGPSLSRSTLSRLLNPSGWNDASSWRTSLTVALLMILITGV